MTSLSECQGDFDSPPRMRTIAEDQRALCEAIGAVQEVATEEPMSVIDVTDTVKRKYRHLPASTIHTAMMMLVEDGALELDNFYYLRCPCSRKT